MAHFGRCVYLTFVNARVSGLHVFNLQRPCARGLHQEYPEPVVGDEQQPIDSEYVRVPPSYPRNLWEKKKKINKINKKTKQKNPTNLIRIEANSTKLSVQN